MLFKSSSQKFELRLGLCPKYYAGILVSRRNIFTTFDNNHSTLLIKAFIGRPVYYYYSNVI
jgi:hypothetical protein